MAEIINVRDANRLKIDHGGIVATLVALCALVAPARAAPCDALSAEVGSAISDSVLEEFRTEALAVGGHIGVMRRGAFTQARAVAAQAALVDPDVVRADPIVLAKARVPAAGIGAELLLVGVDTDGSTPVLGVDGLVAEGRTELRGDAPIVIGAGIASALGLHVGDAIDLVGVRAHAKPRARRFRVAGTLHFPVLRGDYDQGLAIAREADVRALADVDVEAVAVWLSNPARAPQVAAALGRALGASFDVLPWQELNRSTFDAASRKGRWIGTELGFGLAIGAPTWCLR